MMVMIVTIEEDESSSDVIDWLDFKGHTSFRLNTNNYFTNNKGTTVAISSTEEDITFNETNHLSQADAVWIRRIPYRVAGWPALPHVKDPQIYNEIRYHLDDELEKWFYGMLKMVGSKKVLSGNVDNLIMNKIFALQKAKNAGLNIPDTMITSERKKLEAFQKKHQQIITKPISDPQHLPTDSTHFYSHTALVEARDLQEGYSEEIFPTFVQAYIEKEYELRVFYWLGDFYPMAIFSQNNKKTEVDFREAADELNIRKVPYKLPEKIETQLRTLLNELDLETASIDIIKNKVGEYVFLEVNTTGFFGMVSHPCNYHLDEKIATYLTE